MVQRSRNLAPISLHVSSVGGLRSMPASPMVSPPGFSAAHGKLHKRGNSASSIPSPRSSTTAAPSDGVAYSFHRARTSSGAINSHEPWPETTGYDQNNGTADDMYGQAGRSSPAPGKHGIQVKIKPYLRKLSSTKDTNVVDLNRPAAENEVLGLGIEDAYMPPSQRNASDVQFSSIGTRHVHRRSTSNNSQFSNSPSLPRPTAPYRHPLRQTPRPYTPPIGHSYPNSTMESEADAAAEADDVMSDEELRYRQHIFDPSRRSGSVSSATAPALTLHTTGSLSRLGSASQTSLSMASPTVSRPRGDTLRSFETTTSPSSRTSLDKSYTFSFLRGNGRDSPVDAATRHREIQAARQAYREREEAKERKAEKEAMKQQDREIRKNLRQGERVRRKSEASHRASISNEKIEPRTSVGGRQYSDYAPTHTMSIPARTATSDARRTESAPELSRTKSAQSTWLTFVTWFRTRLLRIGRRMGNR